MDRDPEGAPRSFFARHADAIIAITLIALLGILVALNV